jgi:two-component system, OmpR family, sensor histidine kinase MtrB
MTNMRVSSASRCLGSKRPRLDIIRMFGLSSASSAASLRTVFATAMGALGFSTLVAVLALVSISHYMHEAVTAMMAATESVHTAEEMEVDLLVHDRLNDAMGRAQLEGQLRGWLLEIRSHVDSVEEDRLVDEVAARVDSYLRQSHERSSASASGQASSAEISPALENAFLPLEELVHLNVRQTRATAERAARWDRVANYVGVGVASVLVLTVGFVLLWIRLFALRSVLTLETAMRRFAQGDKAARAPVEGARELRDIATRFNEMAAALARQYDNQIAFLGGVVHDLRNPLSVLKLSTEILRPDRPPPGADQVQRTLGSVKRQVERLERMLEDLLDAARVEGGHLELRRTRRDLREIGREVLDAFRESTNKHELRLSLPEVPLMLEVDPLRIEQVLTNLVSNAIKYSPQGGLVHVKLESREQHVVLSVSDQGIGISEEDQGRIFEPFRRSGASRDLVPGAGMGLFVARRIVEAHGGRIEVGSEPSAGTCFSVYLPKIAPHAA